MERFIAKNQSVAYQTLLKVIVHPISYPHHVGDSSDKCNKLALAKLYLQTSAPDPGICYWGGGGGGGGKVLPEGWQCMRSCFNGAGVGGGGDRLLRAIYEHVWYETTPIVLYHTCTWDW